MGAAATWYRPNMSHRENRRGLPPAWSTHAGAACRLYPMQRAEVEESADSLRPRPARPPGSASSRRPRRPDDITTAHQVPGPALKAARHQGPELQHDATLAALQTLETSLRARSLLTAVGHGRRGCPTWALVPPTESREHIDAARTPPKPHHGAAPAPDALRPAQPTHRYLRTRLGHRPGSRASAARERDKLIPRLRPATRRRLSEATRPGPP